MTDLVMRALGLKKEVASQEDSERLELMDGLERTRVQMQQAYLQFDTVEDPDLIESSVFEIKSLQARYTYLLRRGEGPGSRLNMSTETQVLWGLGVFGGLLLLVLLRRAVAAVVKLALRTAVGAGVLAALSCVGGVIGLNLGVNLSNALVLGVLGAPGLGLLMMLNWLVRGG